MPYNIVPYCADCPVCPLVFGSFHYASSQRYVVGCHFLLCCCSRSVLACLLLRFQLCAPPVALDSCVPSGVDSSASSVYFRNCPERSPFCLVCPFVQSFLFAWVLVACHFGFLFFLALFSSLVFRSFFSSLNLRGREKKERVGSLR